MMKIDYLRTFIAVAEAGELADAGVRIGRTPAALSMTLKQVEAEFGGSALFEGERKGRLTPLGVYALAQSRRAVAECDSAVANVRNFASGELGVARVAAVPTAATGVIPLAIQRLRARRPAARVDLRDLDSAAVVQAVVGGAVDFGIATLAWAMPGLVAEALLEDPFVLVCQAGHRLTALDRPIRWSDIESRDFIANGLCTIMAAPEVAELASRALLTVRNTTSLLAFIEQGFGVTLLPALAAPKSDKLRSLALEDRSAKRRLDVLVRQGESLNPAASALLAEVRGVARELETALRQG
jgi:LysR family carnitine catabolism transcriptional activator